MVCIVIFCVGISLETRCMHQQMCLLRTQHLSQPFASTASVIFASGSELNELTGKRVFEPNLCYALVHLKDGSIFTLELTSPLPATKFASSSTFRTVDKALIGKDKDGVKWNINLM
jgi:hypothetical protein